MFQSCFGQDLGDEALDMVNQTAAQMYEDLAALKHLHELLSCVFPALLDNQHALRHSTSISLCLEAQGFLLCRSARCCSGFPGFAEWFERLAAAATQQPPSCRRWKTVTLMSQRLLSKNNGPWKFDISKVVSTKNLSKSFELLNQIAWFSERHLFLLQTVSFEFC